MFADNLVHGQLHRHDPSQSALRWAAARFRGNSSSSSACLRLVDDESSSGVLVLGPCSKIGASA